MTGWRDETPPQGMTETAYGNPWAGKQPATPPTGFPGCAAPGCGCWAADKGCQDLRLKVQPGVIGAQQCRLGCKG